MLADHPFLKLQRLQAFRQQVARNVLRPVGEQPAGRRQELVHGQEHVSQVQVVGQGVQQSRLDALGVVPGHPDGGRHVVGLLEVHAVLRVGQDVRVCPQQVYRPLTIGTPQLQSQLHRQSGAGQKLHEHPHPGLLQKVTLNLNGTLPGNALHLRQPLRLGLQDGKGLLSELLHQPFGQLGTDALDDAGG